MQYLSTVFSLTVITFLSRSLVSSLLTSLSMALALTSLYCLDAICLTSACSFFRMEVMNFRLLKALYIVSCLLPLQFVLALLIDFAHDSRS